MSSTRASRSRSKGGISDSEWAGEDGASDLATASHYLNARGGLKRKLETAYTVHNNPKRRRQRREEGKDGGDAEGAWELQDVYCWECHKECVEGAADCDRCPRTFHPDCLPKGVAAPEPETTDPWHCPTCTRIAEAESPEGMAASMKKVGRGSLSAMLACALKRMHHSDAEPFSRPVPASLVPEYYDLIFHPLDLSTLERRIKAEAYASAAAFYEDARWILHNCIIFNGQSTKFCADAKLILKIAAHELAEIELCPDCYQASVGRKDLWFTEVCQPPHCLVWAKLKGFPFWPAKALRLSLDKKLVDVRFFGQHDRAWLPVSAACLASEEPPSPAKNTRRHGWEASMEEMNEHKRRLRKAFGKKFGLVKGRVELKPEFIAYEQCPLFGGPPALEALTAATMGSEEGEAGSEVGSSSVSSLQAKEEEESGDSSSLGVFERLSRSISKAEAEIAVGAAKTGTSSRDPSQEPQEEEEELRDEETGEEEAETMEEEEGIEATLPQPVPSTETDADANNGTSIPKTKPVSAATNSPIASLFGKRSGATANANSAQPTNPTSTRKKMDLDALVDRMREGAEKTPPPRSAPTPPVNANSSSSNANPNTASSLSSVPGISVTPATPSPNPVKKSSVVITHERMVAKREPSPKAKRVGDAGAELEAVFKRHSEAMSSALASGLRELWAEALPLIQSAPAMGENGGGAEGSSGWAHSTIVASIRREMAALRAETSALAEAERKEALAKERRRGEEELKTAVAEAKRRQWCASCGREAVFYCCWNTSYCDYPCQQAHWPKHQLSCAQIRSAGGVSGNGAASSNSNGLPLPPPRASSHQHQHQHQHQPILPPHPLSAASSSASSKSSATPPPRMPPFIPAYLRR